MNIEIQKLSRSPFIRGLALVILFTASTRLEPLSHSVLDLDLWWHLRGGDAIVAQHALPERGVFSQHSERPWVEYSWGFEVILSRVYRSFGLIGLTVFRSAVEAFITAVLFFTLLRGLGSFWQSWALTALGMWAIQHNLGLQPMLCSVALMMLELALIFEARRRGTMRPLYVLPFLFLLWANLHIQFVYGIVVLMLLAGDGILRAILPAQWADENQARPQLPLAPLLGVTALSVLATLVGPYSWRLYSVLVSYVQSSVPYTIIRELQALSFRSPQHFVFILILAGAFFALGWRHSRDPFAISLLVICTIISLRMRRDCWFACLPALAIIADREGIASRVFLRSKRALTFAAATAVASLLMFAVIEWDANASNATLERMVAEYYPVDACNFARTHSLPGPIYNDMNWGGFLIWALPDKPVAIDNRTDLYGDALLRRAYETEQGTADWSANPDLRAARTVILNWYVPLARELAQNPNFHLVYSDQRAAIFVRNDVEPNSAANHIAGPQEQTASR